MKEEELYDLIDLYLKGELPEDHPFQIKLLVNDELKNEVEIHRLLKDAIFDKELLSFKQEFRNYHEVQKINVEAQRKIWLYGAVIVLTLLIGFLVFKKFASKPGKEMKKVYVQSPVLLEKGNKDYINDSVKKTIFKLPRIQEIETQESIPEILVNDTITKKGQQSIFEKSGKFIALPTKELAAHELSANLQVPEIIKSAHIPCENVDITSRINAEAPCQGKDNGTLKLEQIIGGELPYEYSVTNAQVFQTSNVFNNLEAGKYTIVIRDKNKCTVIVDSNFVLPAKTCNVFMKLSFNPQLGLLDIPREIKENGKLQIYNKSGQIVVYKEVSSTETINWDGTFDGASLPPGLYMFSLSYSSGKIEQGSITIIY